SASSGARRPLSTSADYSRAFRDGPPAVTSSAIVDVSVRAPTPAPLDFRTLFELEVGYVVRSLRRLGVAPADLAAMAHEVFMAVHGQLQNYDRARPLRPWLFAFAFRIASHYRRRAWRETDLSEAAEVADDGDAPDATLEKEAKRRVVLDALGHIELERRA